MAEIEREFRAKFFKVKLLFAFDISETIGHRLIKS